jgi:hypothetical protein
MPSIIKNNNPSLNQTQTMSTSPDGSGKYSDGPSQGSYNSPSHAPANGYSNNVPSSTPINAPGGTDYTAWNWEQVLNGVLGMNLPNRSSVSGIRWTVSDSKNEGTSLFPIFGFGGGPTAFGILPGLYVYLSPDLQDPGGPWDEYYSTPANEFTQIFSSAPPNYTTTAVDPRTFGSAAEAFGGVEDMYLNASGYFYARGSNLNSEASHFQGQAGQAFYNLINDLFTATESIQRELGSSLSPTSYSGRLEQSGDDTATFVVGLWQTIGSWQERLDHTPVGAIYQALLDGGVVSGSPGGFYIPNVLDAGVFGSLLDDATWVAVENQAKQLWLTSIQQTLDTNAQSLINALTVSYMSTAGLLQPLNTPRLPAVGPPAGDNFNTGGGLNIGGLNIGGLNGIGDGLNDLGHDLSNIGNDLSGGLNNLGGGLGNLGDDFGGDFNSLGAGLGNLGSNLGNGFNSLGGGLGNLGSNLGNGPNSLGGGLGSLGGLNGTAGGLNGTGGDLDGSGGLNGLSGFTNPGGSNGLGNVTGLLNGSSGNSTLGQLRTALGDNTAQRQALQQALALAPSSGPLHKELEQALADNGAVQSALQSALAGTTPAGTALQAALTGNGNVQSELDQALNSGLVPKSGPLRTALQQAAGDNTHTKAALGSALGSAVPGGGSLHAALTHNSEVQAEVRHLLGSGLVPRTGPLHDALESALAKSQQARQALDHALASGGSPSVNSVQRALADNRAVRHDLTTALASGQIPATGPLRSELQAALNQSRNVSTDLRSALTSSGVPAEPVTTTSALGTPGGLALQALLGRGGAGGAGSGALGGVGGALGGGAGALGGPGALGGAGGGAFTGGIGKSGLTGSAGTAGSGTGGLSALGGASGGGSVSSGRYLPPGGTTQTTQTSGSPSGSGVPFYSPMAGSGMSQNGQQGNQERERTTFLAEDEDVWGTAPTVGPASIGRDFDDLDDEMGGYDDFAEPVTRSRPPQYRQGAH